MFLKNKKNKGILSAPRIRELGGFLFLFLFLIQFSAAYADSGDTTKQYALNDPRNPNCPCHKYQKKAEDEYKKLQSLNNGESKERSNSESRLKNKTAAVDKAPPRHFASVLKFAAVYADSGDTSKQYALNDPRNPNCPCHKNQKKAEDEYKKLQHQNHEKLTESTSSESSPKNITASADKPVTRHINNILKKSKRKNILNFRNNFKRLFHRKNSKQKKFKINYDNCFRWK